MTAVLFDVDGVLVHGYHAKPEFRKCWDENLERDFGKIAAFQSPARYQRHTAVKPTWDFSGLNRFPIVIMRGTNTQKRAKFDNFCGCCPALGGIFSSVGHPSPTRGMYLEG